MTGHGSPPRKAAHLRRPLAGILSLVLALCSALVATGPAAPALAAGSPLIWSQNAPATSPSARYGASMAYDLDSKQPILFGGCCLLGADGDTWTWDGSNWSQLHPATSPPARFGASMAFFPDFGMVLFGGFDSHNTPLNDTWIWDRGNWTQIWPLDGSPPARADASMAYDTTSNQLILFGGEGAQSILGDTWSFSRISSDTRGSGLGWTQLQPSASPSPRLLASMSTKSPYSGAPILFGGESLGPLNDTWEWDYNNWRQLTPAASPPARYGASFTFDQNSNQLVLFGGSNAGLFDTATAQNYLGDTWVWDGSNWSNATPYTGPPGRYEASMASDPNTKQLILLGGSTFNSVLGDTWHPLYSVTNCSGDPNVPGSLAYAASYASTGDTVAFTVDCPSSSPVQLSQSIDPILTGVSQPSVTIDGSGHTVVITGGGNNNMFYAGNGLTLTLRNLTLSGGSHAISVDHSTVTVDHSTLSGNSGVGSGAIYNNGGTLTITNSTLSSNSATGALGAGGAIDNDSGTVSITNTTLSSNSAELGGAISSQYGSVTITNSTLSGNSALEDGGVLISEGNTKTNVTISNSTLSGNSASRDGGAMAIYDGTVSITNGTVSGNSASRDGGAIENAGGQVSTSNSTLAGNTASDNGGAINNDLVQATIANSTLFGNSAAGAGGAIYNGDGLTVTSSTISGNAASAGGPAIYNNGASGMTIGNTIIANSIFGANCSNGWTTGMNGIIDRGYNLDTDGSCLNAGTGDISGQDPQFASSSPQQNGGSTATIALKGTSSAVDYIPAASCPSTDQRGATRPDEGEGYCDIGAYEYDGADLRQTITWNGPAQTSYTYGDAPFTVSATASSGLPVTFSIASGSGSVCSASGTNGATITITGVGTCTVNVNQAGDATYLPATQVSQNYTINRPTTGCPTTESALSAEISFAYGATFTLSCTANTTINFTSPIMITGNITIDASGSPGTVTLDGGGQTRLFTVSPGASLTLEHLTLTHGSNPNGMGGAISSTNATVTISGSTLSGSSAFYGGAIGNDGGSLIISNSTLSGNSAAEFGGAVFNAGSNAFKTTYPAGTVTISDSTLSSNATVAPNGLEGGAIENEGTLSISNSTLSGNSSYTDSGAIDSGSNNNDTKVTISDSTLYANSASRYGAAVSNAQNPYNGYSSTAEIGGTIIANSSGSGACHNTGSLIDDGYNLTDSTSSCGLSGKIGDLTNTDPQLDPNGLQNNGGPTQTIALRHGSPAIDRIPAANCPSKDQRGTTRPDSGEGACDIGAYEYDGPDQQVQTITWPTPAQTTFTYGDGSFTVSATASSGLAVSFSIDPSSGSVCSIGGLNGATITILSAGMCKVLADQPGNSSYLPATQVSQTFTINRADQTITFGTLSNKMYGDPSFNVSATASSGLPVSYSAGATDQCTISGSTVTITGAGSCTVTASQAGNGNYNAAPSVSKSFAIAQATPTFSFDLSTLPAKTYGNAAFSVAGYTNSDSTGAVTFALGTGSAGCAVTSAGMVTITAAVVGTESCIVQASQAADSNHVAAGPISQSFHIARADQTITFNALSGHTYGDAPFTVSATASSGLSVSFSIGPTDQCGVSASTVTITGAGSCTVTTSQRGDGNYNAATSVSQTFSIAKAAGTITLNAASLSATYDGNSHTVTATTSPPGLSYSVSYTDGNGNSVTNPLNAGIYSVTASITDPNYAGNTKGTLTIAQANQSITVTGHAPSGAAYKASFTVAATAGSGLDVAYGSSGSCTNRGATFTMTSGTGTCTVTYDQAGNGNYTVATEVTESVTAQQAGQIITFGALPNKTYGDAPFSISATASSGLPVSFSVGTADGCTISGTTVTITGAGSCTVTASQAGDGNYNGATSVPQTFTIAKASTVTAVTSSATPSVVKQGVTFTVTVARAMAGSGTPVGTVTLMDGSTTLASGLTLNASGTATFTTSSLTIGTHGISASYSGNANFSGSTTGATLSQQVRYNVKVLSTSNLNTVLQLQDYTGANDSVSTLTVTAQCVVPYSQTPPPACGATPVQSITKAFGFLNSYKGMGSAYSYSINPHGLTTGQQYYLLVQTDGDPIWHAVAFTA